MNNLFCTQCGWGEYSKPAGSRCGNRLANGGRCSRKLRTTKADPRGRGSKGGSAPLSPSSPTVKVEISMTTDERDALRSIAKVQGISMSAVVRQWIEG